MLVLVALLLVVVDVGVHGSGTGGGVEDPVLGVDEHGNLHINTTATNTSVYVNGRDVQGEVSALEALISLQASAMAGLAGKASSLAAEQERLLSSLGICTNVSFSQLRVITTIAVNPYSVIAADVDGDGDADVLSASTGDDKIAWYENQDGKGNFSQPRVITTAADQAYSVSVADVDGDGDLDVLSASNGDDKIAWYKNVDGNGNFSQQRVITTSADGARSVFAADLDGDGDVDVLSASFEDGKIAWYANEDGSGNFSAQKVIASDAQGAFSVFAADLDGDGDMDVLSASWDAAEIAWYENGDGGGAFSQQKLIAVDAIGAVSVFAADLDGDGDVDVLAAIASENKVAWYMNEDGAGSFSEKKVITISASSVRHVVAADLDGDGDLDVLSASADDDTIGWYENMDGQGAFSERQIIAASADGALAVFAVDVDGDGDLDVLSSSHNDNMIGWYENLCV